MLSANLWVEVGLVNGALRTVQADCYKSGQNPPALPLAVTVKFVSYGSLILPDGTVPITPLCRTWFSTFMPIELAWAVTIHKSQGHTLDKVLIDIRIRKKEFSSDLTFVACSRVRHLTDLLFVSTVHHSAYSHLNGGHT